MIDNSRKFGNFETYTREGAERLCEMIIAYWAAQGRTVTAEPYELPRLNKLDRRAWGVKSNIVITRFDASIPAIVQRQTPLECSKYAPRNIPKEAA